MSSLSLGLGHGVTRQRLPDRRCSAIPHQQRSSCQHRASLRRRQPPLRAARGESLASDFTLSKGQLSQFDALQDVMRRYALWVSAACIVGLASLVDSANSLQSFQLSKLVHTLLRSCTALLVWQAAQVLPSTAVAADKQLPRLLQWLRSMSMAFSQMGSLSVLAATVAAMEAARMWPALVPTWTVALSALVIGRYMALQYLLHKYEMGSNGMVVRLNQLQHGEGGSIPWLERMSLVLVAGPVFVCYDFPESDDKLQPSESANRNPRTAAAARVLKTQAQLGQEPTEEREGGEAAETPSDWSASITQSLAPDAVAKEEQKDDESSGNGDESSGKGNESGGKGDGSSTESSSGGGSTGSTGGDEKKEGSAGGSSGQAEAQEKEEPEFEFTSNHERNFIIFVRSLYHGHISV